MNAEQLLTAVRRWADSQSDIRAVALVGSRARGGARVESDIDLVILCAEPTQYVRDLHWLSTFGEVKRADVEEWGNVQSVRTLYVNGPEVEFGVTRVDWVSHPLDAGTSAVLANGVLR